MNDENAKSSSYKEKEGECERYKLTVSYEGTRFSGFQRQTSNSSCDVAKKSFKKIKKGDTIQQILEDALEFYTGLPRDKLMVRFAGRTDAGVHAKGNVVCVSLPKKKEDHWRRRKSINARLPRDISVDTIGKPPSINASIWLPLNMCITELIMIPVLF